MLEIYAVKTGYPMRTFDVVSAFPHAAEEDPNIFMKPPREWAEEAALEEAFGTRQSAAAWTQEQLDVTTARANELQVEYVWNLVRVLYGRRPASSLRG